MFQLLVDRCGLPFAAALIALSVMVWALGLAWLLAVLCRCKDRSAYPTGLQALGAISTQVGLLGSVVGMIQAFSGTDVADWDRTLATALRLAFWTTAVGIWNALAASSLSVAARMLEHLLGLPVPLQSP
jgi:hypothetical protein